MTSRQPFLALAGVTILTVFAAAAAAAVPAPPDVRVSGRVLDSVTLQPVPGAQVFVREWRARCDVEGRFFLVLPPGHWKLEASAERYFAGSTRVEACAGCAAQVELLLSPEHRVEEHLVVAASVSAGADLVGTTSVRPTEVLNVAGAFENVFRVLQTLPGVASTGELSSRLSVRGGGPDQNLTVMDGVEIHNPYRLYGIVSAFNPETVQAFELSSGAFSARYGDRLSSILTIDNRSGNASTPLTGSLGLSLTDGNAVAEGRLPGQAGSWLLTGRRTWYDLVAERFSDDELPAFDDVQARVVLELGRGRRLSLSGLRSREDSDMTYTEDSASGSSDSRTRNDMAAASLLLPLGRHGSSRTTAAYYRNAHTYALDARFRNELSRSNSPYDDVGFGTFDLVGRLERVILDRSLRQELTLGLGSRHVLGTGFELHDLETSEGLQLDVLSRPDEGLHPQLYSYDASHSHRRYGAWLLDRVRLWPAVDLEAGLRYDLSQVNGKAAFTPRVSLAVRATPATRLHAAFGLHTQSPGYEKLLQADYLLDLSGERPLPLDNEKAAHAVLGVERALAPGASLRVEAFYKRFDDLLLGRLETPEQAAERVSAYDFPAELADSVPRRAMVTAYPGNEARGTAYGFDVLLVRRAVSSASRLTGWLAYTYTSAERQAYGRRYAFEYEQPHALNVVANLRAHQRLELSLTGRFASGFPRTAPLGLRATGVVDTTDADGDGVTAEVVPERDGDGRLVYSIDYGSVENLNLRRQPWYARLDFRATFVPRWGKGRWRLYVDVLNVLARNNGLVHDELEHDPGSEQPRLVTKREDGFPFLPSFGLHVRF